MTIAPILSTPKWVSWLRGVDLLTLPSTFDLVLHCRVMTSDLKTVLSYTAQPIVREDQWTHIDFHIRSRKRDRDAGFVVFFQVTVKGFGMDDHQRTIQVKTPHIRGPNKAGWYTMRLDLSKPPYRGLLKSAIYAVLGSKIRPRVVQPYTSNPQRPNEARYRPAQKYTWKSLSGVTQDTYVDELVYSRNWTGTRTPNYGKLKSRRLPVNAHTSSMFWLYSNIGVRIADELPHLQAVTEINQFTNWWGVPGAPSHDASLSFKAVRRLITKANKGIDANLAQDMAQFSQILRLVRTTQNRLIGSVVALKNGNIPRAIKLLWSGDNPRFRPRGGPSVSKSLAQNWLELQYGWKPLLRDMQVVMQMIKNENSSSDAIHRVTASASVRKSYDVPIFDSSVGMNIGRIYTNDSSRFRYGIRYKVQSQWMTYLQQFGFTNPINLAWEVLPFSFVYDWIHPIGPYLESRSAFDGLVFLDGFTTRFTRRNVFATVKATKVWAPTSIWSRYGQYSSQYVVLNRDKLTSFPVPHFPSVKNPVSLTHVLNGLALMRVLFGRRR